MRVAIFAPKFVRASETFIYDSACELAAAGVDVHVIAASREMEQERPFPQVRIAPEAGRGDLLRLFRRLLPLRLAGDDEPFAVQAGRIRRHLEAIRPDVLLAHYGEAGVVCAPACEGAGVPLVVSFHGADASRTPRRPAWLARYRRLFARAALVTAPSAYLRDRLIDLGCPPGKARVQRNGIRVERLQMGPPSERFDGRHVNFLFVGRLTHKKAPITLLEAFAQARAALAPSLHARLAMIGDGPLRAEVEAGVERLGLTGSVEILGRQPHPEVVRRFSLSHVYVQHSVTAPSGDQEGLPVSITEAMAAGLPVIATRHSGIPEVVVEGETGLLVAEHDAEGMAAAMAELARDPARWDRYGAAGRRHLEGEFSMPIVISRLRDLLAEASGLSRAARQAV
jgi:glycosyltransferase involved in cell wall biosynthesis